MPSALRRVISNANAVASQGKYFRVKFYPLCAMSREPSANPVNVRHSPATLVVRQDSRIARSWPYDGQASDLCGPFAMDAFSFKRT